MEKRKIAIIGSGNMGLAIANGLVKAKMYQAQEIILTRRNVEALKPLAKRGFEISNDNAEAVKNADIVVLAVLPQQIAEIAKEISGSVDVKKHLVISVMAGVTCTQLRDLLNNFVPIVRAMPNTAISIGESMTCIATENATLEQMALVKKIFDTVGVTIEIKENLMAAATALCSCGIAFFLRSIRAATESGVELGFHAHEALEMAVQTVKGAAVLLEKHHSHPEVEIDKVTSPGGSTIAGLNELEHNGFSSALIKAVKASADKASGGLLKK